MKDILLLIVLLAPILKSCHSEKGSPLVKDPEIEQHILEVMNNHEVPGMAVAVIKDDAVLHKGYYGLSDLELNEAISNKTVFKVFSLTKTFVAISVFKLIEEGKLSLNDSLSDHFDGLPQKWQQVTIGNLLSHSSGLPDIRELIAELENDSISDQELVEMLYDKEMQFTTSVQWNYNQTNFILLKMLIEKESNVKFEEFVLGHQFPSAKKGDVLFSSGYDSTVVNLAKYYSYDREAKKYTRKKDFSGRKNHPLAGMNLTLDEYIAWSTRLDNDDHISEASKAAMWSPFKFTESDRKFMYGWDVYTVNDYDSFGFSGGGVSGFRKYVDNGLSIILLTTGFKNYSVHDVMIDQIAGIVDSSLYNKIGTLTEKIMATYFLKEPLSNYKGIIEKVKKEYSGTNFEEIFNSIGFTLFFQLDKKEEAIELFKLNVAEYPDAYDTYGSLGYLYFLTERYEVAKENYIKALELNPENRYSKRRIKEIDEILKSKG